MMEGEEEEKGGGEWRGYGEEGRMRDREEQKEGRR